MYNSIRDLMQQTQTDYWAVNMGPITDYDTLRESEYLIKVGLEEAEEDGLLAMTASSYDHEADRLVPHLDRPGPRVVTFAPLLVNERVPLNRALVALLACCEHAAGTEVEIEFAVNLPQRSGEAARLGFLQVRPLLVSEQTVEIAPEDLEAEDVLVSSDSALGNGSIDSLVDIVYVKPETFDSAKTRAIAAQIEEVNRALLADNRRYVLIGFGRWGTSDPWLGIPITWGQISGARAIVESSLPQVVADPSQGSHFFHNVTSLRIFYLSAGTRGRGVQWDWLRELPAISDTEFVRHVRVESPLVVRVDGRSGRGLIAKTRTVRPS